MRVVTRLARLGRHPSVAAVEEEYHRQRGSSETYHAYGWTTVRYGGGPPRDAIVAWIPGRSGPEMALWPVYVGVAPPDLDGVASWRWDGSLGAPTLEPSILREIQPLQTDMHGPCVIYHGHLIRGAWHPC